MKKLLFILTVLLPCVIFSGCSKNDEAEITQNPPKLISIIPKAGSVGGTAIVSGVNFSENLEENKVYINGVEAQITSASSKMIVITLPDNPIGTYSVKVSVNDLSVEGLKFRYAEAPATPELAVLQVMPSFAYVGDEVELIGQCFSTNIEENEVYVNGVKAEVKEATEKTLKIIIPETKEGSYPIVVKCNGKEASSPDFTYLHTVTLTTTSIYPESGKAGTEAVITGEGFGKTIEENEVYVNDVKATVKEVTPNELTIIIPENVPGTYPVKVIAGDKTVDNIMFTYEAFTYTVSTVAGSGATTLTDGLGTAASFKYPECLSLAPNGDIWIVDRGNNAIRKMDKNYNVTTVAKSGTVTFNAPWQGDFDASGNYFVANKAVNNIIKIAQDGTCSIFSTTTTFKSPMSITFDKIGNMYVSDRDNKAVKKIATDGTVTSYSLSDFASGPNCITIDKKGRIYVGTGGTYKIHMIDTDGTVSTLFGTGTKPTADTYSDGEPGDLSTATMGATFGIAIGSDDILYITDNTMHTIRTLTPDANGDYSKGTLRTIAGMKGKTGKTDGEGLSSLFNAPASILPLGDKIYVADGNNHLIRLLTVNK